MYPQTHGLNIRTYRIYKHAMHMSFTHTYKPYRTEHELYTREHLSIYRRKQADCGWWQYYAHTENLKLILRVTSCLYILRMIGAHTFENAFTYYSVCVYIGAA